jgi:two-component system cell cycle response regulator DivK
MAKKVLIVEDNELNMKLFHDLLDSQGYETLQTRGLRLALARNTARIDPDGHPLPRLGPEVTKWAGKTTPGPLWPSQLRRRRIREGGCEAHFQADSVHFLDTIRLLGRERTMSAHPTADDIEANVKLLEAGRRVLRGAGPPGRPHGPGDAAAESPDIIPDHMPGRTIRPPPAEGRPVTRHIPVVLVTALTAARPDRGQAGADEFLTADRRRRAFPGQPDPAEAGWTNVRPGASGRRIGVIAGAAARGWHRRPGADRRRQRAPGPAADGRTGEHRPVFETDRRT